MTHKRLATVLLLCMLVIIAVCTAFLSGIAHRSFLGEVSLKVGTKTFSPSVPWICALAAGTVVALLLLVRRPLFHHRAR